MRAPKPSFLPEYPERAAYVVVGVIEVEGRRFAAGPDVGVRARQARARARLRVRDRHASRRRTYRRALRRMEFRLILARTASSRPRRIGVPGA